ncbi:GMP synthase [glutamine-hydrolyzing] [Clostridia bacterium]|nr:GMP synthase [glutamine-hydrolyzing] [Clostridia bacterium]
MNSNIVIIDFGGQYNQLIARRVREHNIYCEVVSWKTPVSEIAAKKPNGIIFTGGPASVYDENAPTVDSGVFGLGIPVLGICYGQHLMVQVLGGEIVHTSEERAAEFGRAEIEYKCSPLFDNMNDSVKHAWMSHNNHVGRLPDGFSVIAATGKCKFAAIADENRRFYGVQFHPEVNHTDDGSRILGNFLLEICRCEQSWTMHNYAEIAVADIRRQVGDGRVLLGLSGGVDSSVAAALLDRAVGERLTCIFVDTGFMRKDEGDEVEAAFRDSRMTFVRVNAEDRFLGIVAGISDPEKKRKLIGAEFVRVFEEEAKKIGKVDFLAQGTIYPDVIESGLGDSAVIKSHHNVGGLPDNIEFNELVEPLRMLFKDEVRKLGTELELPDSLVWRQPFPGPGLAIRIIGEITREKLTILQEADSIFREEIAAAGMERDINQYFAVLTNLRSVGVMGDERSYDYTVALRAVTTSDFMTADFAEIPYPVLSRISVRIVNEVKHVNRICYDITSKPPSTIEWE